MRTTKKIKELEKRLLELEHPKLFNKGDIMYIVYFKEYSAIPYKVKEVLLIDTFIDSEWGDRKWKTIKHKYLQTLLNTFNQVVKKIKGYNDIKFETELNSNSRINELKNLVSKITPV